MNPQFSLWLIAVQSRKHQVLSGYLNDPGEAERLEKQGLQRRQANARFSR